MPDSTQTGPIQVSDNGRYFVDRNNKPFFWLGDTQWELFRRFTLDEANAILQNRRDKGFNIIQVMLTGVGDGTKPNLAGHKPWLNDNPSTPNEKYFKNVDAMLNSDYGMGLIFVLGIFHQLQVSLITLANARVYAKWIAERYREMPNIIWTMYPRAEEDYIPVSRELTVGLQEGDGGKNMICVHPDPAPASSSFIHNEAWMAFNNIQTWAHYDAICEMVTNDYRLAPAKPVVMAEGAYEGGSEYGFPVTPLMIRKQAYLSYLSGGYHSYGHNDCWRVLPTWQSALDTPGAYQLGILKEFFANIEWWKLVPDQSIFADSPGNLRAAALTYSGDCAVIYLDSPATICIDMSKITAGDKVNALWMDPRSGSQMKIENYPNKGTRLFSSPSKWEDAILLLRS